MKKNIPAQEILHPMMSQLAGNPTFEIAGEFVSHLALGGKTTWKDDSKGVWKFGDGYNLKKVDNVRFEIA